MFKKNKAFPSLYLIIKRMNVKVTPIGIITSLILLTIVESQFTFAAYGARPNVGFQDGLSDCRSGTSDAINGHSNAGHHSSAYMKAYHRGLHSCNNSDSNNQPNNGQSNSKPDCIGATILGGVLGGAAGLVIGPEGALGGIGAGSTFFKNMCESG